MNQALVLMLGVVMALPVFGAFLWSLTRAVTPGARRLRLAHAGAGAATLLAAAALSWPAPLAAAAFGAALAAAALVALIAERGWNRALPLVQIVAGGTLAAGAPFA